mgnify:FL=1
MKILIKKNLEEITCKGLEIKPNTKIIKLNSFEDLSELQDGQIVMTSMPAIIWTRTSKDIFFYFDGAVCVGPDLDLPLGRLYQFITKLPNFKKVNDIFWFSLGRYHANYEDISFDNGKLICQPKKEINYRKGMKNMPYVIKEDGSKYVMFNQLPNKEYLGRVTCEKIDNLMRSFKI